MTENGLGPTGQGRNARFEQARAEYLEALARFAPVEAERKYMFPDMGRRWGTLCGREIDAWPQWLETSGYEDILEELERAEATLRRCIRTVDWVIGMDREALAAMVELAIDRLDAMDGDPDLEPEEDRCAAGDDGCAPFWLMGQCWWGSRAEAEESSQYLPKPRYGVDQTHPLLPQAALSR